MKLDLSKC